MEIKAKEVLTCWDIKSNGKKIKVQKAIIMIEGASTMKQQC